MGFIRFIGSEVGESTMFICGIRGGWAHSGYLCAEKLEDQPMKMEVEEQENSRTQH